MSLVVDDTNISSGPAGAAIRAALLTITPRRSPPIWITSSMSNQCEVGFRKSHRARTKEVLTSRTRQDRPYARSCFSLHGPATTGKRLRASATFSSG